MSNTISPSTVAPLRPNTSAAPAGFTRDPNIRAWARELEQDCRRGVAAMCVIEAGNAKLEKWAFAYHTNLAKEANLLSAPPGGKLNLTALVNVSGHTGQVETYAKDPKQTFNVSVTGPDGKTQSMKVNRTKPTGAEYVVAVDMQIDVSKPGTYVISGWPEGSGGAGGYVEGRQYKLHVGKQNFFNAASIKPGVQAWKEP